MSRRANVGGPLGSAWRFGIAALAASGCWLALGVQPAVGQSGGFEAESMQLPASQGGSYSEASASGGRALLIWSNGTASAGYEGAAESISVRARGDQCAGAPQMVVAIDGQTVLMEWVRSNEWREHEAAVSIPEGSHDVTVSFTNDFLGWGCDRNLRVDRVTVTAPPPPPPPPPGEEGFEAESMHRALRVRLAERLERLFPNPPTRARPPAPSSAFRCLRIPPRGESMPSAPAPQLPAG